MGKRKIIEAAKKKGLTVVSADWETKVFSGQPHSEWALFFGPEIDTVYGEFEHQAFSHTAEALEWIDSLEPLPPREEEE